MDLTRQNEIIDRDGDYHIYRCWNHLLLLAKSAIGIQTVVELKEQKD